MKHGKKWLALTDKVDRIKLYEPVEGVSLVKELAYSKFDGTVEVHVKVNYKSLQNVRGIVRLPHGNGKKVRVCVIAREDKHQEARDAGADFVGGADLIEKIQKEHWTDFDACVATPDMMKDVGKLGPILGRKGLMPKPKAGTVTTDVGGAVTLLKSGQVEYKADKSGVVHLGIGKVSFDSNKIEDNLRAFYASMIKDKPSDAKGEYIRSLYLAPTMGPSVKINARSLA